MKNNNVAKLEKEISSSQPQKLRVLTKDQE
jgi:hypothetical protein